MTHFPQIWATHEGAPLTFKGFIVFKNNENLKTCIYFQPHIPLMFTENISNILSLAILGS